MTLIMRPGLSRLGENLWLGDAADTLDLAWLSAQGITAIANLTEQTDRMAARGWRGAYKRFDQADGRPIPARVIDDFLAWMRGRRGANEKVLIHCAAGVSRTAAFAILWLMYCGFSWDEAEAMVTAARPVSSPNPVLKESILRYFASLDRPG